MLKIHVSRAIEHIVKRRLITFLEENNLLTNTQHVSAQGRAASHKY